MCRKWNLFNQARLFVIVILLCQSSSLIYANGDDDSITVENLPISQTNEFEALAGVCAPDVHVETLKALVKTESGYNPFAIGVVGGSLKKQPQSLKEALQAILELEKNGSNYSIGLGQINKSNFEAYGETVETLFEPCRNLKVSGSILKNCYETALSQNPSPQRALLLALSCYYSGNFKRGFKKEKSGLSYVQTVQGNANKESKKIPTVPALEPVAGEDENFSLSSKEAAMVLIPASSPAKPKMQNGNSDWFFMTETKSAPSSKNELTERPKNDKQSDISTSKVGHTTEAKAKIGDDLPRQEKASATRSGRLLPGEFVLIID